MTEKQSILVKFSDNWADEFDAKGFALFTPEEWKEYQKEVRDLDFPLQLSIGTNQLIDYPDADGYFQMLKVQQISFKDSKMIEHIFGRHYGCNFFLE
jgi:hypothetical protein